MWIHINNLLAVLSSVCACYIILKEDNFVVLKVVYETENSKVMVMLRELRLGCSRTNMTLTVLRHSGATFST